MSDEQQRGRRAIEIGPTGATVGKNIARYRKRCDLTARRLSALLEQAGRPIPASGITRMERGERVVTADELVALAVVLGVNPSALLLPHDVAGRSNGEVEITGAGTVPGWLAWGWADGVGPLVDPEDDKDGSRWLDFYVGARPEGWNPSKNVGLNRGVANMRRAFDKRFPLPPAEERDDE
jgi:transcriptional regulator with XRE-family HTH domain